MALAAESSWEGRIQVTLHRSKVFVVVNYLLPVNDGGQIHRSRHAMPHIRLMRRRCVFSIYGERAGLLQGTSTRTLSLAVIMAFTATLAHADDMAEMISRYRREHGLSAVKTDPQLTAVAERQAKAMAASGIMDHSVAGSFGSRVSSVNANRAAENIAAGTKTWAETFRMWQNSPGHNANLLQARADSVGVAVARNENTRYKLFWAMVIAEKAPKEKEVRVAAQTKSKEPKVAAQKKTAEQPASFGSSESPLSMVKNFVCKYLCQ
jgi:Cysteine-rich secretory protein family